MAKKKIVVVVNKSWEFEPFYNALTNSKLRPEGLPLPDVVNEVPTDDYMKLPRAEINKLDNIQILFRCVENMMHPDSDKSDSRSKTVYMPDIIIGDNADLIISVSTAESTENMEKQTTSKTLNGSVLIGGNFYAYDARGFNKIVGKEYLDVTEFIPNNIPTDLFDFINDKITQNSIDKFVPQRYAGTTEFYCVADSKYTSVGVINISNYDLYEDADRAAFEDFISKEYHEKGYIPVCIETTHGIVRMCAMREDRPGSKKLAPVPTLFVSPITDRYLSFDDDVKGPQNYIAGFNAGIAVAEMLVALNEYYK